MSVDSCICCGKYVPEGRQVCHECSGDDKKEQISKEEAEMILWLSKASPKKLSREMMRTEKKLFGHALV